MSLDLVIKNARIVDGSGKPSFVGDVAVAGDRIVSVGPIAGAAARTIDATGKVVAPGFLDIHTHYDPQICWDRLATPSLLHGVTTVVLGNCSLSLAPVHKGKSRKLAMMFKQIEDIPLATFDAGVPWTWESFAEYLDAIRPNLGINVSTLVGHSALRLYVMGDAAQERTATDDELKEMCRVLKEAIAAGAGGLSTSYVDIDEDMRPVPSRFADTRERIALAQAMAEAGRGVMQTVPIFYDPAEQLRCIEELGEISLASGIMCTLAPIVFSPQSPDLWKDSIAKLEEQQARGARVYGQSMPRTFDLNMRLSETSFLLFGLPAWNALMKLPLAERLAAFADPSKREELVQQGMFLFGLWMFTTIGETFCAENAPLRGRRLAEIAEERGVQLSEAVLDIAIKDGLRTEFQIRGAIHADPVIVAQILDHPRVLIGASDAGAHISQFCGAGDTAYLLAHFVRERQDFTLERAVHRLTFEPAQAWGIANRGLLQAGYAADLVVFDPATIDRGEEVFVHDFPGDANRYVRSAVGIDQVVVNGQVVVERGAYTAARPGRIV